MTIVRRLLKLALKSLTPIMVNTLVTRLSHALRHSSYRWRSG